MKGRLNYSNSIKKIAIIFFLLLSHAHFSFSQIRLPSIISNGMVLQRDTKLTIWGWAAPKEQVHLNFNGKKYKAVTGADGKWTIVLSPMKAGGPYKMELSASNHIIIDNILVGDVWFCSGQSNMALMMERVKEKYPDVIANSENSQIRNFFVPTLADVSKYHNDIKSAAWKECNAQNVLDFGAVSYFFAKELYAKYHVPIGIVNSSVGGTPIQAWISESGIKNFSNYSKRLDQIRDTAFIDSVNRMAKAKSEKASQKTLPQDKGLISSPKWFDTAYRPTDWHHFWLPGYWEDQGIHKLYGVVWFRKEIIVPASMNTQSLKLYMGRIVNADEAYVNGVLIGNTTYQYPPRRYTVPPGLIRPGKNLIVIRVSNYSDKGGFVPDKTYELTDGKTFIDLRGDWQYKVGHVYPPNFNNAVEYSAQNEPTSLFNAMVNPLIQYKVKGFLWYQGETNAGKPFEYKGLLTGLIHDWRKQWQNDQLPFIYAQLPNFMEVQYSPSESQWAQLRESQFEALAEPNTGMAVSIDAGEWNDIHPLDKKDVGDRLALAAEKVAYGETKMVSSGPLYQSAKIDSGKIIISFSSIGGGLMIKNGDELSHFAIAGRDKKYVWAKAVIKGDKVIVWSDDVSQPLYVRYGWADNPEAANLCNKEGLPASPFTTDTH